MDYVWVILLVILGIAMLIFPHILWKIEHIFSVKNGEPSDIYLALMRIGGIIFIITAITCAIIA
ncbi:MAG: nickel ABC transporter permease [Clostridia bacterium]|nr:nickel ABC transporter permease [Clostridia bacterium]